MVVQSKKWGLLLVAVLFCWVGLAAYARVSLDFCLFKEPLFLWSVCERSALLWLLLSRPLAVFLVVVGLAFLWRWWSGRRLASEYPIK